MRRRLVRLLPPLLLAAATLWLNRDGPQRQLGIARHEARRRLSPQGFRANGPYVDEPRTLVARNRDAGPPHLLTDDPRRPAADERAILEALSWEAAPAAPGFGGAKAQPLPPSSNGRIIPSRNLSSVFLRTTVSRKRSSQASNRKNAGG